MNDWPWPVALLLLLAAAIGHLCHFIMAVNIVSSFGYSERVLNRLRSWIFLALWVSSGALLWIHLRTPFWNWPWPFLAYPILCIISARLSCRLPRCTSRCESGPRELLEHRG